MNRTRRGGAVARLVATGMATFVLAAGALAGTAGTAVAADNPYQRGPAPTAATFTTSTGPFGVATASVPGGSGFGGGTAYYPTATDQGTFGAVVIAPGFTEPGRNNAWFGPRLSSQGFVVLIMDTNSPFDQPAARGTQMLAALDYLTKTSTVKARIDPDRLAVMGHSMGGGGALDASVTRPALQAAIPMEPYETRKNYSTDTVPTLIIGAQNDRTAPTAQHAKPFYNSLAAATDKAYLELAGASHSATNSPSDTVATFTISWLKRFVDDDTRYDQFLCPLPTPGGAISAYQGKCPTG